MKRFWGGMVELLRPPNLFTVPGDPLCGALLAAHGVWNWRLAPAMGISLGCYCAGLLLNDVVDYAEDSRERPGRPLPRGAVSRAAAGWMAAGLLAAAVGCGAALGMGVVTGALAGTVLLYNGWAKRSGVLGPVLMGMCRGLSVLVGAAAVGNGYRDGRVMGTAVLIGVYIATVTVMAREETGRPGRPALIGRLIRGLMLMQAAMCIVAGGAGWVAGAVLVGLWPVSEIVGRRWQGS